MKKEDIRFDWTYLNAENIGEEHGITIDRVKEHKDKVKTFHEELIAEREAGKIGFYELPYDKHTVKNIEKFADKQKKKFDNFVVLGIGGSALGNIALQNSLNHLYYNQFPTKRRKAPRIHVLDNVDPEFISDFLDIYDPEKTLFNVISKSGSTAETAAQFLIFVDLLKKKLGKKFTKNLVITTDEKKGTLREIANAYGIQTFEIPENVGGRFSVLTNVGLLTAAMAGLDIRTLLKGAAAMLVRCDTDDIMENPAYLNALLHYLLDRKKGKNISVMMSYSTSLYYWADWYRQLWAESLGKEKDLNGKPVNVGQIPVKALGVTDQHSQVQLYTEGPNDKVFTFLTVDKYRNDITLPDFERKYSSLRYLSGHKLSELFDAEMKATEYALTKKERPSCRVIFPSINEYTIGQFIMMYEIQTAFAGKLYNINAFDQPGVEEGKKATYGLLGRVGYEEEAKEIVKSDKKRLVV